MSISFIDSSSFLSRKFGFTVFDMKNPGLLKVTYSGSSLFDSSDSFEKESSSSWGVNCEFIFSWMGFLENKLLNVFKIGLGASLLSEFVSELFSLSLEVVCLHLLLDFHLLEKKVCLNSICLSSINSWGFSCSLILPLLVRM